MTCKDCIHYDVCDVYQANVVDKMSPRLCGCFKPKSRYIELPCAVGDTVYVPWRYAGQRGIAVTSVKKIRLYNTNPSDIMFFIDLESDNECINMSFGGWKTTRYIGKTVFLTKEAAEKALDRSEGK